MQKKKNSNVKICYSTCGRDGRYRWPSSADYSAKIIDPCFASVLHARIHYIADTGSEAAAKAGAIHLSLVASAKRNGIDPVAYLIDIFTRINSLRTSELEQFLPDRWIPPEEKDDNSPILAALPP